MNYSWEPLLIACRRDFPVVLQDSQLGEYLMKHLAFAASVLATAIASAVLAQGDLSRSNVITVKMEMGSYYDGLYLTPNNYEFETGQAYKLVITNVDQIKLELALNEMVERIEDSTPPITGGAKKPCP